jgi:hypothetical protein
MKLLPGKIKLFFFVITAVSTGVSFIYPCKVFSQEKNIIEKNIVLNASIRFQTIDGFGANVNPAEWRDGSMKPALDSIVKGLGSTLIRFDCFGFANWLNPAQEKRDGTFPETYLEKVYTSKPFQNAWAAFRYLNELGVKPMFNVSGAVPYAWTTENPVPRSWTVIPGSTHDRLKNFDSYATMVATMLQWAREKEHLKFSCVMPFNETDLGFPEGPRLLDEDCIPAFDAVVKKMIEYNLEDLVFVIMDDSGEHLERLRNIIKNDVYKNKILGIGLHTYGGGEREQAMVRQMMDTYGFKNRSLWLTEYGDLDQTQEIEFEIGWRMNKRLLTALNNNISGAMVWDAFDNFHKHDTAFALYGLLKTDTINWTYKPKERYYAAKQIFKYVLPGFQRIAVETPDDKPMHIYNEWLYTLRNMPLAAFTSTDQKQLTVTGMNGTEKEVKLNIRLSGFTQNINGMHLNYYRTSEKEHCIKISDAVIENNRVIISLPPHCMFTLSSVTD